MLHGVNRKKFGKNVLRAELPMSLEDSFWSRDTKHAESFLYGALSGIVEPIAGIATVAIVGGATVAMPWLLSFAAGAMIYVVVEELIPEANLDAHSHAGTYGVMIGFLIMMIMDVALG